MVRTRFALIPHGGPQGCIPYPVKCFLEINEDMVQILLLLEVLFTQDSEIFIVYQFAVCKNKSKYGLVVKSSTAKHSIIGTT